MDLKDIYTEVIMEHSKNKKNKKPMENPTLSELGHNPSCGDEITLNIKLNGDIIEDASFEGIGCAISQASTSMMIDLIKGKTIDEAKDLVATFLGMIKGDTIDEKDLDKLDDAIALQNVSKLPARVKCAVLAWHTLDELLKDK